jgi:hypothetical protein
MKYRTMISLLGVALVSALAFNRMWVAKAGSGGVAFGPPVQVTGDPAKGYEPSLVVDKFGNIFATAHKENYQLAVGPDYNSPTYTRSMSYAWTSTDGGKTFQNLPGLTTLSLEQHEFGDEGDMALDDANHLYFVDTNVADDTITRWTISDAGTYYMTLDYTRPVILSAEPVDDRPWTIAHGDGHVFYFGNEGDKVTYPLGQGQGSGFGPGRYTVYASYDGGQHFNTTGYTLRDSGWCRPAADHAPGSQYVYAFCTDDGGANGVYTGNNPKGNLYSYVSSDDGHTFERYFVGNYNSTDSSTSWPSVYVSADGSIWALYVDAGATTNCSTDQFNVTTCAPVDNRLMLFHSTDHGKAWSKQDITPQSGRYRYAWLSISPDGNSLGLGVFYRPDPQTDWQVYGSIFAPGQVPVLTALAAKNPVAPASSEPPGDFMSTYFNPDGTLGVIWTRNDDKIGGAARISRTIFYARSLPPGPAAPTPTPCVITPNNPCPAGTTDGGPNSGGGGSNPLHVPTPPLRVP